MHQLYPQIDLRREHHIEAGDGHVVYAAECGDPGGHPVLFIHGGPGSACGPGHRRFFDPRRFRIILMDQRGCGRSTPFGETRANRTDLLVRDMETVRRQLGVGGWVLFGGSWGATLALAYAREHTGLVRGMILRAPFLARARDLDWFFGAGGAARIFPEDYAVFVDRLSAAERDDPVAAYHRRVHRDDGEEAIASARAWSAWSDRVTTWTLPESGPGDAPVPERLLARVRIETHYAVHRHFLADRPLLETAPGLAGIPVTLVHGRRDLVCPFEAGWSLHRAIPGSRLVALPETGHLAFEPAMVDALVAETIRLDRALGEP